MSAADKAVLEQIVVDGEKGQNTPMDAEKEFLVRELRRIQGNVNTKPCGKDINAIIEKGLSANPPKLIQRAGLDAKKYRGVIERFFNKFAKVSARLAGTPAS